MTFSEGSFSGKLSLSEWKHRGVDIWRPPYKDEIHHSATWSSHGTINPSIFHTETDSSSQRAWASIHVKIRCDAVHLVASLPFTAAEPGPQAITRHNGAINQCLFFLFFSEVSRNDSCPDLPEIQNGWKTTSHVALVRGAHITYQCDPGYDLVGRETLNCQLDLSWSSQPPFCEKSQFPSYLNSLYLTVMFQTEYVDVSVNWLQELKISLGCFC